MVSGYNIGLDQGLINYSPWAKSSLLPVFVKKAFLEYNYTHL